MSDRNIQPHSRQISLTALDHHSVADMNVCVIRIPAVATDPIVIRIQLSQECLASEKENNTERLRTAPERHSASSGHTTGESKIIAHSSVA